METSAFVYCPQCATRLERQERFGAQRPVCPACDFVHFRDPKVAVIAFVTHGNRLLLIRRAVNPAKGKWALPGGYMDAGEMPDEALKRELLEEVGLEIDIERLLTILPMGGNGQKVRGIVLAYAAKPRRTMTVHPLQCNDDVSAAGWFTPNELPTEMAFASTQDLVTQWRERTA
jgi:ADP-ribose pyrophosphatase YjhB (NUDIX family)